MPELGQLHRVAVDLATSISRTLFQLRPGWRCLESAMAARFRHGDLPRWQAALDSLPTLTHHDAHYSDTVSVTGDLSHAQQAQLHECLMALVPWRKGPFRIGDTTIDTEWRSDWKWRRVAPQIDLVGAQVLDVGCGNGYYGWRMLDAGAQSVIGVDPTLLFVAQFQAIATLINDRRISIAPLTLEDLEPLAAAELSFDTVFSMGVLYHRREPLDHLQRLARMLKPGGQVVLETLTAGNAETFVPVDRYARMRNVWCVPSIDDLTTWLSEAAFSDIAVVDLTTTTTDEQRSTEWMPFESLAEALNPEDCKRTIEGLPAPLRVVLTARKS